MADINITNNLNSNSSNVAQPSNLVDKLSAQIQQALDGISLTKSQIKTDSQGLKIELPQLINYLSNQTELTLKTEGKVNFNLGGDIKIFIDKADLITKNVLGQTTNILKIQGQVGPTEVNSNSNFQKFSSEIQIQNNNNIVNNTSQNKLISLNQDKFNDKIVTSFLKISAQNLSPTIKAFLPANLQNLNLSSNNNFNISLVTIPDTNSSSVINLQANSNNLKIITGEIINLSNNNISIKTEFGVFKLDSSANFPILPNGSLISFFINDENYNPQTNFLDLNPENIQTLKLALQSDSSPIQNLLKIFSSNSALIPFLQRLFPNPEDKEIIAKHLMFLSASAKGSAEDWVGSKGEILINKLSEIDSGMNKLVEFFSATKIMAGKQEPNINQNQNWNSYIVPYYDGVKLTYVTLQVESDEEKNLNNSKTRKRFILELEQEDLGQIAIEGNFSKIAGKVDNLNLIFRSQNKLEEKFKQDVSYIFNEVSSSFGFAGSISFDDYNNKIKVNSEISKILGDGIVI
jgi:hypothetical protein